MSIQIATIHLAIGVCTNGHGHGHITSTTAQSCYDQTGGSVGLGRPSTHIKWKATGMGQVCMLKVLPVCGYQERYQMTMAYYGSYDGPVPARYSPLWRASCTNSHCHFHFRWAAGKSDLSGAARRGVITAAPERPHPTTRPRQSTGAH